MRLPLPCDAGNGRQHGRVQGRARAGNAPLASDQHRRAADARRLVRQSLLMGVEPQVDDVADAKSVDIGQLRLGGVGRGPYSIFTTTPAVKSFQCLPRKLSLS